jgi:methylenetetrahydrofolate reductase (NADPH)
MCVEMMKGLSSVKGVHGVHITAIAWEEIIPRLVSEAGLRP